MRTFTDDEVKEAAIQVRWGDNPACPICFLPLKKEVLKAGKVCQHCGNRASVFHGTLFKRQRSSLWPLMVMATYQKGYHPHLRHLTQVLKKGRRGALAEIFGLSRAVVYHWLNKFPPRGGYFNKEDLLTIALAMDTIDVLKGRTHQGRFKKCLESGRDSMVASKPGEDSHPRIFSGQ